MQWLIYKTTKTTNGRLAGLILLLFLALSCYADATNYAPNYTIHENTASSKSEDGKRGGKASCGLKLFLENFSEPGM